jgi:hypothetical protein
MFYDAKLLIIYPARFVEKSKLTVLSGPGLPRVMHMLAVCALGKTILGGFQLFPIHLLQKFLL